MLEYTISVNRKPHKVYRFIYEPVNSNMYFLPLGEIGLVFDPNVSEELQSLFKQLGIKRIQIVLTHEHHDHTTGVVWLQELIDSQLYCNEDCAHQISSEKGNMPRLVAVALKTKDLADGGHRYEEFMGSYKPYSLKADKTFRKRDNLTIEDCTIECYSTPGHSLGSACYILDNRYIFTGDSLIQNTPTITRFRTSDNDAFETITRPFLRSLDKNMLVFPGHGEPFKINEAKYL